MGRISIGRESILLDAEQGFGNAVQFIRYVPMVVERGGKVVLRCHRGLRQLLVGQCNLETVVELDEVPPAFEAYCPLPSLPRVFRTELDTIPGPAPT